MNGTRQLLAFGCGLVMMATGACGDSKDTAEVKSATATVGSANPQAAACSTLVDIRLRQLDHASPNYFRDLSSFADAWKTFAGQVGDPSAAAASTAVSTNIAEAVQAEDVSLLFAPANIAEEAKTDQWAASACGYGQATVAAENSSMRIKGDTLAGPIVFRFENHGDTPHQLTVNRIRDEIEESPEQVMATADIGELLSKFEVITNGSEVEPGEVVHLVTRLERGRYLLVDPSDAGDSPAFRQAYWTQLVVE